MKKLMFLVAAVAVLSMTGCTTDYSGSAYDPEFVRKPHVVKTGVIVSMANVQIQGKEGVLGSVGGGVVGGVLGSTVGGGKGSTIAATLGAVGGAAIGGAIEKKATTQSAVEFYVRLEDGNVISVVQTLGGDSFAPGQKVLVLVANDGTTRIRPVQAGL